MGIDSNDFIPQLGNEEGIEGRIAGIAQDSSLDIHLEPRHRLPPTPEPVAVIDLYRRRPRIILLQKIRDKAQLIQVRPGI